MDRDLLASVFVDCRWEVIHYYEEQLRNDRKTRKEDSRFSTVIRSSRGCPAPAAQTGASFEGTAAHGETFDALQSLSG